MSEMKDLNEPLMDGIAKTATEIERETIYQKQEAVLKAAMKKLWCVSFVSIFFIAAQGTGGYLANSIAIWADTAHLATDLIGFVLSMVSLKISSKSAKGRLTFGWQRAEIFGTLLSIIFLVVITIFLVIEATKRIEKPEVIDSNTMLITAVASLFFNIVQMNILHGSHDHDGHYKMEGKEELEEAHGHSHGHSHGDKGHSHENINVQSAALHVMGDLLMSVGVIISSTLIYFKPEWYIADPICTYFFSVIVCVTVWPTLKNCFNVILEAAPEGIDTEAIRKDIKHVEHVVGVHDLHIWSISVGKISLTVHVHVEQGTEQAALKRISAMLQDKHGIDHVTIQCEDNSNVNESNFKCIQTLHAMESALLEDGV